ncbi:pentatricopeptide repeat-containing protein At1g28690, mitochondrial [Impatiens glandulifera]|uniref:pentatricopeptide repeat-containing protein At1g28690, mitochondrial n=1 Tax=Impatiens glandulifera TaxID=253017 RepID=UPI001FB19A57|nr:pentatricopeptide repeat-containing protein At1g28690, mitochondrial [Impatiens glandulifera]
MNNGRLLNGRLAPIVRFRKTLIRKNHTLSPQVETVYLWESPNADSISSALQYYINHSEHPFNGLKIHSSIIKLGFIPNVNISIKLLILHLKSGSMSYAHQMFDELPNPQIPSPYNYMISGYIRNGQILESFDFARRLAFNYVKPDGFTFSMILKASIVLPSAIRLLGRQAHAQILRHDIIADDVLYTALVDSYVKSGSISYARRVFDMMLEKNVICSTSMISGYMNQGSVEDAEYIFHKTPEKDVVAFNAMIEGYSKSIETAGKAICVFVDMQRLYFKPTISTYASIIGACSVLSSFVIGQQVQAQIMKTELFTTDNIKMGSALIDMYSKCGRTDDARRVFDEMPQKNVFTWTSMIDGHGKNGNPNEALSLFEEMKRNDNVKPNYVTFLAVLTACAHGGLVGEGRKIFESMERIYKMKPRMEHYACVVDLMGRAGNLNMAWEFVMGMDEKPSSDVWAALLNSCKLHDDLELANIAAMKLNDGHLRPGSYVALSNAFAAAGNWDSVSRVREMMKTRGISKDTAFSYLGKHEEKCH